MSKRTHATLTAVALFSCLAGAAHAAGNYSQNFATAPSGWSTALGAWNATTRFRLGTRDRIRRSRSTVAGPSTKAMDAPQSPSTNSTSASEACG